VVAGLLLGGAEDTAQYLYDRAGTRDLVMFAIILTALLLRSEDGGNPVATATRRAVAKLGAGMPSLLRRRLGAAR